MSIEKDFGGDYILECDVCGAEADEVFETFQEAVDYKKNKENGWISKKIDGQWHDVCPECKEGKQ